MYFIVRFRSMKYDKLYTNIKKSLIISIIKYELDLLN